MSIATCGHEVEHGITTTRVGDIPNSTVYGTYCAECILGMHNEGELLDPELVRLINQLRLSGHVQERESDRTKQLLGMIDSKNKRIQFLEQKVDWLLTECKKELSAKDKRIAHLETEITRVFDPIRKFWNERGAV